MPTLKVTTIDPPTGRDEPDVTGVNASGEAVGYDSDVVIINGTGNHGFVDQAGSVTEFNDPDGTNTTTTASGAIDDAGDIVGTYYIDQNNNFTQYSYIDQNGTFTTLSDPAAIRGETIVNGINPGGVAFGSAFPTGPVTTQVGFTYQNGTFTSVVVPGATLVNVTGVDAAGDVVGSFQNTSASASQGFVLDSHGTVTTLDVPGAADTYVAGVNPAGDIYGSYLASGSTVRQGFVDIDGTLTTIAPIAGAAKGTLVEGINAAGDIVGQYEDSSFLKHGFIDQNGTITTFEAVSGDVQTLVSGVSPDGVIYGEYEDSSAKMHGFTAAILCFASGTSIRTARGEVEVGALRVGDLAVTASGTRRPIAWVGSRTIQCRALPMPSEAWPVRIRAGAFGGGLPERDLFLSPGHPVLVGRGLGAASEVLVPVMCLINGTSIARVPVEDVTYWHVELDAHDILLAEGLPAESYLDLGCRAWFETGADHALANPDFIAPGLGRRCRPVVLDGPIVEAERRRLDALFEMDLAAQCAWPVADGSAPRLPVFEPSRATFAAHLTR